MSDDRTVHGRSRGGMEIVRYDKAGKWYLEGGQLPSGEPRSRFQVSLDEAVDLATQVGSCVYPGMPGGKTFDARLRAWSESV